MRPGIGGVWKWVCLGAEVAPYFEHSRRFSPELAALLLGVLGKRPLLPGLPRRRLAPDSPPPSNKPVPHLWATKVCLLGSDELSASRIP